MLLRCFTVIVLITWLVIQSLEQANKILFLPQGEIRYFLYPQVLLLFFRSTQTFLVSSKWTLGRLKYLYHRIQNLFIYFIYFLNLFNLIFYIFFWNYLTYPWFLISWLVFYGAHTLRLTLRHTKSVTTGLSLFGLQNLTGTCKGKSGCYSKHNLDSRHKVDNSALHNNTNVCYVKATEK